MEMLEVYKEFAQINEGFVKVEKNTDLKLPECVKTPSKEDIEKINKKCAKGYGSFVTGYNELAVAA